MNTATLNSISNESSHDWADYSRGIAWGTVGLCGIVVSSYLALLAGLISGEISLLSGMLIATVIIYLGFTVAHEAGHGNISHEVQWMKPVERAMGWLMTLLFMILPFGLFARIHDYHHAFTNDPDRDPDFWVEGDTWMQASGRATTLPLHYLYLTLTRFKHDPVISQTHTSSIIYYLVTFSLVAGLIYAGLWRELLIVGIIPIFLASFVLGMLFDWIPHMPNRQQGRYQNTRSYLFPGLRWLTLGQNYHHIHHLYPRVTWYQYHCVFDKIRPELEALNAPIERCFSGISPSDRTLPSFGNSPYAQQPSVVDGFHKMTLTVQQIERLTDQSVCITFAPCNGQVMPFKAGQYITASKLIDSEPVTRCYSICSAPDSGKLQIGVKQVDGGKMSTYLNRHITAGDEISIAGPFGEFVYETGMNDKDTPLILAAGGSGITPILSIARLALQQTKQNVCLIYANRSAAEMMFASEIKRMQQQYENRFAVTHILEDPEGQENALRGFIDNHKLERIFSDIPRIKQAPFYICGPEPMKKVIVDYLGSQEIVPSQIHLESFIQSIPEPAGVVHPVNVRLADGRQLDFDVAENQTLLQAAQHQGITLPHACGAGQCGCCMMQVEQGVSVLANQNPPGLLPGEQAQGYTLACQCQPRSGMKLRI